MGSRDFSNRIALRSSFVGVGSGGGMPKPLADCHRPHSPNRFSSMSSHELGLPGAVDISDAGTPDFARVASSAGSIPLSNITSDAGASAAPNTPTEAGKVLEIVQAEEAYAS